MSMIRRAVELARTAKGIIKMAIEISKLAKKYTINNNEIIFKVVKNQILQLLDKKRRFLTVIAKDGKQFNFTPIGVYSFLRLLDAGWLIKESSEDKITLCKENLCMRIRSNTTLDVAIFREIFLDKVYGEKFYGTIIDVGAYNGDSLIYFALNGAERVIGLEPFPENFELAKENIEINNLSDKIILLPYALAREDGETQFYVSKIEPQENSLKT